MDWKKELESLERDKRWADAIALLKEAIAQHPDNGEPYVRAIYLLLNLLLEEDYAAANLEHDNLAAMLTQYFDSTLKKFKDDAESLFFIGYFVGLAEWYFGQEDLDLSHQMLKKATEIEPQNLLYQWAYKFAIGDKSAAQLCEALVSSTEIMTWLKSKGSPGRYMIGIIRSSCES